MLYRNKQAVITVESNRIGVRLDILCRKGACSNSMENIPPHQLERLSSQANPKPLKSLPLSTCSHRASSLTWSSALTLNSRASARLKGACGSPLWFPVERLHSRLELACCELDGETLLCSLCGDGKYELRRGPCYVHRRSLMRVYIPVKNRSDFVPGAVLLTGYTLQQLSPYTLHRCEW